MVAHDLVYRKRHILLDLVADEFFELVLRYGRELGETGRDRLPVQRDDERRGLYALFAHYPKKRGRERDLQRTRRLADRRQIGLAIGRERQGVSAPQLVFGQHRLRGADV